jgi:hypothetical protein
VKTVEIEKSTEKEKSVQKQTTAIACYPREAIIEALNLARAFAPAGIRFEQSLPEGIHPAPMASAKFWWVASKLIGNALETLGGESGGGIVRVAVQNADCASRNYVLLTVAHSRPETPTRAVHHVQGLAIVRELIEGAGGVVRTAARPDGGAAFTVCLPAVGQRCPA